MRAVVIEDSDEGHLELDVCNSCHFVWFDPGEFGRTPVRERRPGDKEPPPKELPAEARQALALARVEAMAEEAKKDPDGLEVAHPALWAFLILGFPVELNRHSVTRVPLVTWMLAVALVAVSLLGFSDSSTAFNEWGVVPAELGRKGGLTLITSFFLHAGWLHLISNGYFLLVFGDNTEEVLGPLRYLLLIVISTVAGALLQTALDPESPLPMVGASGGIAGVLVFYSLRFPRARLGTLVLLRWIVRFPVMLWVGFWVLLQLVGVVLEQDGGSGIAFGAHLGGALAGLVLWALWREST